MPEWLNEDTPFRLAIPPRVDLPRRLEDGESVRGFVGIDEAAYEFRYCEEVTYTYVLASGTVYLSRDSRLRQRIRDRRRIGEGRKPRT